VRGRLASHSYSVSTPSCHVSLTTSASGSDVNVAAIEGTGHMTAGATWPIVSRSRVLLRVREVPWNGDCRVFSTLGCRASDIKQSFSWKTLITRRVDRYSFCDTRPARNALFSAMHPAVTAVVLRVAEVQITVKGRFSDKVSISGYLGEHVISYTPHTHTTTCGQPCVARISHSPSDFCHVTPPQLRVLASCRVPCAV